MKIDKKLNIKVNKELKEYLYMLVGKELTYEDKEKILSYFNDLKQQNDRMKRKAVIRLTMIEWRIGKAIKYIKRYEQINGYYDSCYDGQYDTYSHDNVKEELLDILKGSDTNVKD